ncbi:DUF4268 domain-containing protein [Rhodococcus ruber]|uniref:DUF4268 domain-containing protein n=1 Tax=Rhodococcus ruber TaxID=1830 RepID=UPI00209C0128|nr:DUF4268 domain-containing protein [Rhodococcus ruber]
MVLLQHSKFDEQTPLGAGSRSANLGCMSSSSLGRLQIVPPREIWPHEALDFTPWLLQNVDVLSDLLGMDLVLEVAEHPVGDFSLDLKGYDEATCEIVIVENQLAPSDHTHLGQIITYAAGTDPTTIVWVTTGFRSEHRAAIDWLNQRTDENTRVFGVVIQVVKIDESQPAPNFELVAQPNDWEKRVKKASASGTSMTSRRYRQFWEAALEQIRLRHPDWTRARTTDASWCNTSVGLGGMVLSMAWVNGTLVAQFYFDSRDSDLNQARFDTLHDRRGDFEAVLGRAAMWDRMEGRKGARIVVTSPFGDIDDVDRWPDMIDWLIEQQLRLRGALAGVGGVTALRDIALR